MRFMSDASTYRPPRRPQENFSQVLQIGKIGSLCINHLCTIPTVPTEGTAGWLVLVHNKPYEFNASSNQNPLIYSVFESFEDNAARE